MTKAKFMRTIVRAGGRWGKKKPTLQSLCWIKILESFEDLNSWYKQRRELDKIYENKKGRSSTSGFIDSSEHERSDKPKNEYMHNYYD